MRNRKKQRANHKKKVMRMRAEAEQARQEELLDKYNGCGVKDLTAYNAVLRMKTGGRAGIALR